jgi:ankyrin repeat protein
MESIETGRPTWFQELVLNDKDQLLREAVYHGDLEKVKIIIDGGANVNHAIFGLPLICLASMSVVAAMDKCNRLAVLETLVEHGADVTVEDDFGWSPFHWADCSVLEITQVFKHILEAGIHGSAVTG